MSRPDVRVITEAKALSALANPYRTRLVDALKVDGPSTASALAKRTGQAVGSVSHHLKVLAEAKLVEEAPELAKDRRERWWRLTSPGTRWSRSEFADDAAAVNAAVAAENLALALQFQRARDWQDNYEAAGEWDDASFATQQWLKLTPDELRQLSRELVELILDWSRRDVPDDGQEREPVFLFARGFPAQP
jgi:DNA-binding transcriptional ArsR family regulator